MRYIDVHSHLQDKAFDIDRESIINQMHNDDISTIIIGVDYEDSKRAMDISNAHHNVYYTIGVHPCDDSEATFDAERFVALLSTKCVAIGECGLDYYYFKSNYQKLIDSRADNTWIDVEYQSYVKSEKQRQSSLFKDQIQYANKYNLPLMLHGRPSEQNAIDNIDGMDAYHDMINALEAEPRDALLVGDSLGDERAKWGNVHFFVGDINVADKFMHLGFDFSFGGVITITNDYDEVLRHIPVDRVHAETDSPYVVPRDTTGKRVGRVNTPLNISIIIDKISQIKGIDREVLEKQLIINTENMFNIGIN